MRWCFSALQTKGTPLTHPQNSYYSALPLGGNTSRALSRGNPPLMINPWHCEPPGISFPPWLSIKGGVPLLLECSELRTREALSVSAASPQLSDQDSFILLKITQDSKEPLFIWVASAHSVFEMKAMNF